MFFNLILFLTFINFVVACPNGSIASLSDFSKCYLFQTTKTNWIVADQGCKNLGGNLVSIHNVFDNVFLSGEASTIFTDSTSTNFWTGANSHLTPGLWTWIDNTTFDWNDWDKGQPQNTSDTNCGGMLIQTEKWMAADCMSNKPYVSCLETWTFFNYTGACYKVFDNATWLDAEERCKIDGAHLASVHSLEENVFLANLAYYPGANDCDGFKQAFFGMFIDDPKGHWKYTDGTPYDYSNWWTGITYTVETSVGAYMHVAPVCDSPAGVFEFVNFQAVLAKFICKMQPS